MIPSDWGPMRRRDGNTASHAHARREGRGRTQGGHRRLQVEEMGLRRNRPLRHLDLRLRASRQRDRNLLFCGALLWRPGRHLSPSFRPPDEDALVSCVSSAPYVGPGGSSVPPPPFLPPVHLPRPLLSNQERFLCPRGLPKPPVFTVPCSPASWAQVSARLLLVSVVWSRSPTAPCHCPSPVQRR